MPFFHVVLAAVPTVEMIFFLKSFILVQDLLIFLFVLVHVDLAHSVDFDQGDEILLRDF